LIFCDKKAIQNIIRFRIVKPLIWVGGGLACILLIRYLLSLCLILLITITVGSPPGPEYANCEKYISPTNGIRIVAKKDHTEFLEGGAFIFAATTDSGQTWVELMRFRHDDPIQPACENIRSLDAQHFWVWMGTTMGVTHDGGKTWATWKPQDTWRDWKCCNYGLIKDVEFKDALTGEMFLDPISGRGEESALFTKDGGITWYGNR
jgi:hypothetical protein